MDLHLLKQAAKKKRDLIDNTYITRKPTVGDIASYIQEVIDEAISLAALDTPAETGEREAVERPEGDTDDAPVATVLQEVLRCARAWEPKARILGNVRAADIDRAISRALDLLKPAPAETSAGPGIARVEATGGRDDMGHPMFTLIVGQERIGKPDYRKPLEAEAHIINAAHNAALSGLEERLSEIYEYATNGRITKPNTALFEVKAEIDAVNEDALTEAREQGRREAAEELRDTADLRKTPMGYAVFVRGCRVTPSLPKEEARFIRDRIRSAVTGEDLLATPAPEQAKPVVRIKRTSSKRWGIDGIGGTGAALFGEHPHAPLGPELESLAKILRAAGATVETDLNTAP